MSEVLTEKEIETFSKHVEDSLKEEKKLLIRLSVLRNVLSPFSSLLAPWTSRHYGWLSGYAGLNAVQSFFELSAQPELNKAYNRITDKLYLVFSREVIDQMPEIERETKGSSMLNSSTNSLSRAAVSYLSSKADLIAGRISTAASLGVMATTSLYANMINLTPATITSFVGVTTASTVATYFINRRTLQKGRKKIQILEEELQKKWKEKANAENSLLKNAALKNSTNSYDSAYKKVINAIETDQNIFSKCIRVITNTSKKVSWTSFITNVAVLGTCIVQHIPIELAAGLFMGINVLNNSIKNMQSATYRIKEQGDKMYLTYKKNLEHQKCYELTYGNKKLHENTNTICLHNICYHHRNKEGEKLESAILQSNKTIYIQPGINILGGATGAGKTTLYKLLRHADDLSSGYIAYGTTQNGCFEGKKLTDLEKNEVHKYIAFSFQELEYDEALTGLDLLQAATPMLSKEEIQEHAALFGLSLTNRDEPKKFNTFSGGEKKILLFLQAMMTPKPIIVLDEPTSGVSQNLANKILQYINNDHYIDPQTNEPKKRTIIYTTHNPNDLRKLDINQIIDIAPDKNAPNQENKTSQLTIYPCGTEVEKEAYITFTENRSKDLEKHAKESEQHHRKEIKNTITSLCALAIAKQVTMGKNNTDDKLSETTETPKTSKNNASIPLCTSQQSR